MRTTKGETMPAAAQHHPPRYVPAHRAKRPRRAGVLVCGLVAGLLGTIGVNTPTAFAASRAPQTINFATQANKTLPAMRHGAQSKLRGTSRVY
jgi:hypothetical protein